MVSGTLDDPDDACGTDEYGDDQCRPLDVSVVAARQLEVQERTEHVQRDEGHARQDDVDRDPLTIRPG